MLSARNDDNVLQGCCLTALALTYYMGLMIKSGIKEQDKYNADAFTAVLLFINLSLTCGIMPVGGPVSPSCTD